MKKIKLAVLPGDGIGKEVISAAIPIIEKLNLPIEINYGKIGWEYWCVEGNAVPNATWELINDSDVVLLGATTSMPEKEATKALPLHLQNAPPIYVSPIVQLRQKLDLYVNIRPCFNIKNQGEYFNFCIIRENTEGLYAGLDFFPLPEKLTNVINENSRWSNINSQQASCSLRLQTKDSLIRLFEFAFKYAHDKKFNKVTLADKPNVLRKSSHFVREIFENIANKYPYIRAEIHNVDAVALWIVKRPQDFGVIVAENMFGDILSDIGAAIMGGLGFAPSANIGIKGNYFEPVHGSAPRVNPNTANPCAMFLTISMMLNYLNFNKEAQLIVNSIQDTLKEKSVLTYDLGGDSSTTEMAEKIIQKCLTPSCIKKISLLATGNEIIEGDIIDTNSNYFAKKIVELGGEIYQCLQVSDQKTEISLALKYLLNNSDAVIICGGLGPTSDDNTRFAISEVIKCPLYFDELAWTHIVERLQSFNLKVTNSNKQQALFPTASQLYKNENGTAFGCMTEWQGKQIFMLPGPPKEAIPLFEKHLISTFEEKNFFRKKIVLRWLTLGLIEGEIAPEIDKITELYNLRSGYRWNYPYLEIKIISETSVNLEVIQAIELLLENCIVSTDQRNVFEALESELVKFDKDIYILDKITNLEFINNINEKQVLHKISNLANNKKYIFIVDSDFLPLENLYSCKEIILKIIGLIDYQQQYYHEIKIPNRNPSVIQYINCYIAWQLYQFIKLIKV
jgi:isocitrate dehydrogenase